MSVIIRLQNLPWSANALDIRQFFNGLSIPEGGVHIVGGEQGDAFIAFSTDEDARQAFSRNNGKIKEVQINLNLSSRTEMQRVIEAARNQSYAAFMQPNSTGATPLPPAVPSLMPAAVPDLRKNDTRDAKDNKRGDRRRSRSKSRDRKDKDRDRRDRRYNRGDKSRSRSRDRKDRRRRDRSPSRNRGQSRSRDRKSRDRRDDSKLPNPNKKPEIWSSAPKLNDIAPLSKTPSLLEFAVNMDDDVGRNLSHLGGGGNNGGFMSSAHFNRPSRESWPPQQQQTYSGQSNFSNFGDFNNSPRNQQFMPNDFQNRGNFSNNRFPRNFDERDDIDFIPEKNACVQLEPYFGGYGEIRRFFQGVFISNKGIKFINDEYGSRTGIVYIQCGHHQGKLAALYKNGDILNEIKVQVSHLDDKVFDEAVDRYIPDDEDLMDEEDSRHNFKSKYFNHDQDITDFSALTVDNLPTYVKEQDILHMFSLHPLYTLILTNKPRGGHIAYVKFSTKEVAKKAYEEKSNHIIGGKPVTVKPCSDEEFEEVNKRHEVDLGGNSIPDIGTDCITVSRLPQKTSDRDIADIFSDVGVIPLKVHLVNNLMGFTGQAYCEFQTTSEASRALQKNETVLGAGPIVVKPISRNEMQNILCESQAKMSPTAMAFASMRGLGPFGQRMHPQHLRHPQQRYFRNNSYDNMRGLGPFGGLPPRGMHRPRFAGPALGGVGYMNDDEAPLGCTVYMDNVPYKAGTNDILEFFEDFDISNNVSRRYNPNNTPSAEAKVVFSSPEEAFEAVKEKNGQTIWDRTIFLRQA